MIKLFPRIAFVALLLAGRAFGQESISGIITTSGATCGVNNCVTLNINPNRGAVVIQITGTFGATLVFEATSDASNWSAVSAWPIEDGAPVEDATAVGTWRVNSAGLRGVRVRGSIYSTGAARASLLSSDGSSGGGGGGGGASGGATEATLEDVLIETQVIMADLSDSLDALLAIQAVAESTAPVPVTPSGYTVAVAWGSSVNLAVTNTALVTVSAGTRVIVHRANLICGSTVSVAVTASLGFATATLPTTGAGLIWASVGGTTASQFQGIQDGAGWPNVIGVGASDEDLRLTMSVPTGGACTVSLTYSTEAT
jgi:hypothetical protein